MRIYKGLVVILLLMLLFYGCGYRFTGGGGFPSDVNTIFVTIFKNQTSESGLETIISNELIDEFTKMRKNALAANREESEAILTGVVASIDISTITHQDEITSNERRIKISVDVKLMSQDGLKFWGAKGISADEAYDVIAGNKPQTNLNKSKAIRLAADRLAENIFNRLTEDF